MHARLTSRAPFVNATELRCDDLPTAFTAPVDRPLDQYRYARFKGHKFGRVRIVVDDEGDFRFKEETGD